MRGKSALEHIRQHIFSGAIVPGGPIFDHPQSDCLVLNGKTATVPCFFEDCDNETKRILNALDTDWEGRSTFKSIPVENMLDEETCDAINWRYPNYLQMWHASKPRFTESSQEAVI